MSHSILVVEDDELVRRVIRSALEQAGYDVSEAANGREASQVSETASFDLVITDILMPETDGIETIIQFRKSNPNTRIIAISGADDPLFLTNAVGLGASCVLRKPFAPKQLVALVRSTLDEVAAG